MKRTKNTIKYFLSLFYRLLIATKLVRKKVIVVIDGGICSQMNQRLIGEIFSERGLIVEYDLSFFKRSSKDVNGIHERNFDLLNLYPKANVIKSNTLESIIYRYLFNCIGNYIDEDNGYEYLSSNPPLYLGDYYRIPPKTWLNQFNSLYRNPFVSMDSNSATRSLAEPASVAVHVRRGDLSVELVGYGKPASVVYFEKSIKYFLGIINTPRFYFFSDEPDWVKENLIHIVPENIEYKIMSENGSGKGYLDLYYISLCKHQITSKGSLGKYGALINDSPEKVVVLCDDVTEYYWKQIFHNPVFLK